MKIYRKYNGKRVSHMLSRTELRKAYEEQQHIYDVDDIKNELDSNRDWYTDEYGIDEKPVTENEIEEMAKFLRHLLNNEADSCWSVCVQDAVNKILSERG